MSDNCSTSEPAPAKCINQWVVFVVLVMTIVDTVCLLMVPLVKVYTMNVHVYTYVCAHNVNCRCE